jgi:hypothetical protein
VTPESQPAAAQPAPTDQPEPTEAPAEPEPAAAQEDVSLESILADLKRREGRD